MTTMVTIILLHSFTFLLLLSFSRADILGFSSDLIHIDSPASPFYNPSLTHFDRVRNILRRSHDRVNQFISASKKVDSISSILLPSGGAYIMKVALGTPPLTTFLLADTGSDLTWTQCKPCEKCFMQTDPLFEPKKSSTYKAYPCDSPKCKQTDSSSCTDNNKCGYEIRYADGSVTYGIVASETLSLGLNSSQTVSFSRITFGCGFNNEGIFRKDESGIIGLGAGPSSFISQIKPSIDGKFSYCMTQSFTKNPITSKINFGKNAVVSGTGIASTPLIPNKRISSFYYLNLEAFSVGNYRIELFNSKPESIFKAGNIIIDSGTTLTYLRNSIYHMFANLVREAMGNDTIPDPTKQLDLCYRVRDKLSYPKITAYFTSASVDLKPMNTFIQIHDGVTCLAFLPSHDESQIYGNIAQINFLVGYDTVKGIVSFKPSNCGHVSS